MKQILCNSGDNVEVNALFVQPTYSCTGCNNAKNCYVKNHQQSDHQVDWHEQYKLIEWFALGENNCHANQITVSIDNPPLNNSDLYKQFQYLIRLSRLKRVGELHITVNSPGVLIKYLAMGQSIISISIENFDMISFSSIKNTALGFIQDYQRDTAINYNHLCPTIVNSSTINKQIQHIIDVGEIVNSIYMIVRKAPMKAFYTDQECAQNATRLQQDMSYIRTILERVPEHVRKKLIIDTCIQDAVGSQRTGFGCSANISKFQVWPDGTVSGCPYAYQGVGTPAKSAEDILENIRMARDRYDFNELCSIRKSNDNLSRRCNS